MTALVRRATATGAARRSPLLIPHLRSLLVETRPAPRASLPARRGRTGRPAVPPYHETQRPPRVRAGRELRAEARCGRLSLPGSPAWQRSRTHAAPALHAQIPSAPWPQPRQCLPPPRAIFSPPGRGASKMPSPVPPAGMRRERPERHDRHPAAQHRELPPALENTVIVAAAAQPVNRDRRQVTAHVV